MKFCWKEKKCFSHIMKNYKSKREDPTIYFFRKVCARRYKCTIQPAIKTRDNMGWKTMFCVPMTKCKVLISPLLRDHLSKQTTIFSSLWWSLVTCFTVNTENWSLKGKANFSLQKFLFSLLFGKRLLIWVTGRILPISINFWSRTCSYNADQIRCFRYYIRRRWALLDH